MRPIFALAILLLGLNGAAPEAKYQESVLVPLSSALDLAPSIKKADRELVLAAPSSIGNADGELVLAFPSADPSEESYAPGEDGIAPPQPSAPARVDVEPDAAAQSLDDTCSNLLTSAENNDLPVAFFANLIWQESRLQHDAVSPVGALGIAQFMPQTAIEAGLGNPFDPRQAIPASARLLHALRQQFGNLGFVAAAYNAGAHRVRQWLVHRRTLPRETQTYVVRVTGRSIDQWRKTPPTDSALTFVRLLPCRELPAFAELEQAQLEQTQIQQQAVDPKGDDTDTRRLVADRRYARERRRQEAVRVAARGVHGRHEATRHRAREHERHRTAGAAADCYSRPAKASAINWCVSA